jgi:hypothetical protein
VEAAAQAERKPFRRSAYVQVVAGISGMSDVKTMGRLGGEARRERDVLDGWPVQDGPVGGNAALAPRCGLPATA